jgi:L-ribulose-5-phosphate 4-epimerase
MKSPYQELKEQAWEANVEIPKYGLALFTWGNVSAFDKARGVLAIKPSGVPYDQLKADDLVVLDLDGKIVEGKLRPSSDTPTHRVLYRAFEGLGGIVHTHSTYATAWSQAQIDLPVWGTTHADYSPAPIPCTPPLSKEQVARDYELETGNLIVDIFLKAKPTRDPHITPMVLLGGHAPFTWGKDAHQALHHAVVLEEIAKMAIMTRIASGSKPVPGLPKHVVAKHYDRKHGPGAYYGQS